MMFVVTARVVRVALCLALGPGLLASCRSDENRNSPKSVGVPGSIPAPPDLTNDEAAPSKALAVHDSDASRRTASDGGLVTLTPSVLREDTRLSADSPNLRDSIGITLDAEWKSGDWPLLPNNSRIERERLQEIRARNRWLFRIDLVASGRMRITLDSRGFALEKGTEIRSRVDLLGHLLVWPEGNQYRIILPGGMRALFEEGLPDVGPMLVTSAKDAGTARWLDWETERTDVTNVLGHITIDEAATPGAGVAGRLLCRWLVEFINAEPASPVCHNDLVPVRAQFAFTGGGKAEFIVTQINKKQEFTAPSIGVPPTGAAVNTRDLPRASVVENMLLAEHRSRAPAQDDAAKPTPKGLVAVNHTLGLRALVIDGITAGWLLPGEQRNITELLPGAYSVAWRDFLGNSVEAPKNVSLPTRVTVGTSP